SRFLASSTTTVQGRTISPPRSISLDQIRAGTSHHRSIPQLRCCSRPPPHYETGFRLRVARPATWPCILLSPLHSAWQRQPAWSALSSPPASAQFRLARGQSPAPLSAHPAVFPCASSGFL